MTTYTIIATEPPTKWCRPIHEGDRIEVQITKYPPATVKRVFCASTNTDGTLEWIEIPKAR